MLFFCSLTDSLLGCFHLLTIVSSAAVSIRVQLLESLFSILLSQYLGADLLGTWYLAHFSHGFGMAWPQLLWATGFTPFSQLDVFPPALGCMESFLLLQSVAIGYAFLGSHLHWSGGELVVQMLTLSPCLEGPSTWVDLGLSRVRVGLCHSLLEVSDNPC